MIYADYIILFILLILSIIITIVFLSVKIQLGIIFVVICIIYFIPCCILQHRMKKINSFLNHYDYIPMKQIRAWYKSDYYPSMTNCKQIEQQVFSDISKLSII